jgi:predicted transposase YbfD/YdcC
LLGIKTMTSIKIFEQLPDPRKQNPNTRYSVAQIVFQTIAAVASGCEHWTEIEDFGEDKKEWISRYVEVGDTMPSHDTLRDFFMRLSSDAFVSVFIEWTREICHLTEGEVIALDGKTVRRSYDKSKSKGAIHLISAWVSSSKIVLGQQAVDAKSNEITAIPDLLKLLTIKGAFITIDAIGCQREIAKQIIAQEGEYILAVKSNQKELQEGVLDSFKLQKVSSEFSEINKEHGRIETRNCSVIHRPTEIINIAKWPSLTAIIRIESKREILADNKITNETRYYICSKAIDAKDAFEKVKSHWGIENNLHWSLDVTFGEDLSRMRAGDEDKNFALIRKIIINLLALDKTKMSIQRKRLRASRDDTFRQQLLKI